MTILYYSATLEIVVLSMRFFASHILGFLLLGVLFIVLPLTIFITQQQQQTKQHAATIPSPIASSPIYGNIYWKVDYETGDTSQWNAINTGGSWGNSSITAVTTPEPVHSGKYSGKFTLNGTGGSNDVRAETEATQEETGGYEGQEWYYTWSMYIPSNPNKTTGWGDWNLIAQWMDMLYQCSPPLQVEIKPANTGYDYLLESTLLDNNNNCKSIGPFQSWDLGSLTYDQWTDITVHVKWSTDPAIGFAEVWLNGKHALPLTHFRTLDNSGVYFQQDIYRSDFTGTNIIYFDDLFRHDAYNPTVSVTPSPNPTIISPSPTLSSQPSPTFSQGGTILFITLCPHGIANCGDNANPQSTGNTNPQRTTRSVTVSVADINNNPVTTQQGTVSFDSQSGTFKGSVSLGNIQSGQYIVKVTMPQYLTKQIGASVVQITAGQTNTTPEVFLIAGDITGDNKLDILDYNQIVACFGTKQCTNKQAADLNDDGKVDGVDYNLFLRELSVQNGQ